MNVIGLLLHIGSVIKTVEDGERLVKDILDKQAAGQDAIKTLEDIAGLIASSVIPLPAGLTVAQAQQIISDLKGVL